MSIPPSDATQILRAWRAGDKQAPERLIPLVYDDLRARAANYLRRERADHTLQPTALLHEAYLQLVDQDGAEWQDRAHFCTVAASLMRRILVQHARDRNRLKRGGKWKKVYLDETRELSQSLAPDVLAIDSVLERFGLSYPRESTVVEMKFFGGMTVSEISAMLNVSEKTVQRDWSFAKAWLARELMAEEIHA